MNTYYNSRVCSSIAPNKYDCQSFNTRTGNCGGNFRSIAHYMWQQLTHLCENVARTQLGINATWTGRTGEARAAGTYAPLHTCMYSGRIYVNVSISHATSARERDCVSAKRSHTRNLDPVARCERVLIIGTQVPATRPRTCVRAWAAGWRPKVDTFRTRVRCIKMFSTTKIALAIWKMHGRRGRTLVYAIYKRRRAIRD